jgi:glycosyltransferase involved in cell wall biosynthesis
MILSAIVPSRNRATNLKATLEALANQTLGKEEYEVILVDDNSQDETQTLINQFKDKMRFKYIFSNVPKPHTWNASVIRNLGAVAADPSTLAYVFVDSDVILPPYSLSNYVEDLNINSERVIIGPYDFYREGNTEIAQKDVRSLKFEQVNKSETFSQATDGLACFGGNIVIPKKIFWSVGGFSPDIHIGLEDGDMGLKLWKKQVKFSYDARTRGKHQWHKTPEDRFPSNMKDYINKLNIKHFHTNDPDYGIVEASREAYESWGITGWEVPEEWKKSTMEFSMKINKVDE